MRFVMFLILAGCCPAPKPEPHWHQIGGYWYYFDERGEWVDPIIHKNTVEMPR